MKIKLDENPPTELADLLATYRHDVHTVPAELLTGQPDSRVFEVSVREDRLLMTQDLDFSDVRKFKPGTHPGIVLLRMQHPSRRRIVERITQILQSNPIEAWTRCFVVISDRKLRIRRP